jgi:hypothetical protein
VYSGDQSRPGDAVLRKAHGGAQPKPPINCLRKRPRVTRRSIRGFPSGMVELTGIATESYGSGEMEEYGATMALSSRSDALIERHEAPIVVNSEHEWIAIRDLGLVRVVFAQTVHLLVRRHATAAGFINCSVAPRRKTAQTAAAESVHRSVHGNEVCDL